MKILMYHQVTAGPPPNVHAVSVAEFARQMGWLREAGYRTVSLDEQEAGTGKRIALTFDDGYRDFLTNALPILREHGFTATVFLIAGLMGQVRHWPDGDDDSKPALLTWDEARQIARQGIRLGSHTLTHPDLTAVSPAQAEQELRESRQIIEREIGLPVTSVSYPSGRENAAIRRLAAATGYQRACSGPFRYVGDAGYDPFNLKRITALGIDTLADFAEKVNGSLKRRAAYYRSLVAQRLR